MAFSIADLLSYFSQAADGQRTAPDTPSAGILNQVGAGAGRGAVNPPMVNPNAPRPQAPLSPLPSVEVASRPVASVLAEEPAVPPMQFAMNPTDQRLAAGTQQAPMSPEPQSPGILSQIGDVYGKLRSSGVLNRLGNGLISAGSQDPGKMIALLQQGDAEAAKIREAQKKANQPKVDHVPGTPFFQVTTPDGKIQMVNNPELAKYYEQDAARKLLEKQNTIQYTADANEAARTRGETRKSASEAAPQLKQVQDQIEAINIARETLPRMGTMDQLKGAAGGVGDFAASLTNPQMNIDSQRRAAVRVLDWVRSSEPLKGALSNVEGLKLDMPLPKPSAAKEEWEAYFDNSERVLRAAEAYYKGKVEKGAAASAAPAAPAAGGNTPPPSDQLRAAVTAAGIPFEPEKFQYRIGPNGQVQRKAK